MVQTETSTESVLKMQGICKQFGKQVVLNKVNFDLYPGEVHVLAGENGAGKSTLIKILAGVHQCDSGVVTISGKDAQPRSPKEAAELGIAVIHQELSLVPSMSVTDNIFLGREQSRYGLMHFNNQRKKATAIIKQLKMNVDVDMNVGELPISLQQMTEIAKALAYEANIIVMDEPTSALHDPEVENLFARIDELKQRGCGIIYITHKLEEIYKIADRITVLRDGNRIITSKVTELNEKQLIHHMVGKNLKELAATKLLSDNSIKLSITECSVRSQISGRPDVVDKVSFKLGKGEILGIAGLQGSGASNLLHAIFGALGRRAFVSIEIDGKRVRITSPRHAIRIGIALITNNRKHTGLVSTMDVMENATLASLKNVSSGAWMNTRKEMDMTLKSTSSLHLRASSLRQSINTLSGGNQQKVVLAKWLNTNPQIMLLDEPTRGVDIGAKQEIYQLMNKWREEGRSMLLITSELPELLLMSDRIMVMHRGKVAAVFNRKEATQENILHAAMGGIVNAG